MLGIPASLNALISDCPFALFSGDNATPKGAKYCANSRIALSDCAPTPGVIL